jgi:hypothetical protein
MKFLLLKHLFLKEVTSNQVAQNVTLTHIYLPL